VLIPHSPRQHPEPRPWVITKPAACRCGACAGGRSCCGWPEATYSRPSPDPGRLALHRLLCSQGRPHNTGHMHGSWGRLAAPPPPHTARVKPKTHKTQTQNTQDRQSNPGKPMLLTPRWLLTKSQCAQSVSCRVGAGMLPPTRKRGSRPLVVVAQVQCADLMPCWWPGRRGCCSK
jgi:hypothetical protein